MKNKSTYSPFKDFVKKFKKQKMAMASLFVVTFIVLLGILSPYFVPYNPTLPVTNQYQEKGLDIEHLTTTNIPYQIIYSDGSVKNTSTNGTPVIDSQNRRIASARGINNSINATAVNMGETYVTVSLNGVTNLIKVVVTRAEHDKPIVSSLKTNQVNSPLSVGDSFTIEVEALLTDGEQVTDPLAIQEAAANVDELIGTQGTALEFTSLNPQIASVNNQGEISTISQGIALIKVSIGDVETVLQVPVEVEDYTPIPVTFELAKREIELMDIYKHQPPSSLHWFGTDHQNRDIFSRILVGTRQTLIIGFLSVAIGTVLGTILGLFAGYYGGWVDSLLTRMCDVLLAFPGILLAIAVIAILGPGIYNIIFAVAVFTVPIFIRIVRASTLSLKNMTYVEAAKSIGVKDYIIIFRHIFPGTLSVVIVYLTMRIGTAILIGASLSYLGLGGDVTAPEWGAMLNAAKNSSRNVFHPTLFPGLAIVITVLAFNLLGDGLRDALDPKIKD
ncbi:ABC transporter permease subunit [Alkalicella caledoniensis]|nr:ABC transporter permease subunit [Alkalicella caledoniensis]